MARGSGEDRLGEGPGGCGDGRGHGLQSGGAPRWAPPHPRAGAAQQEGAVAAGQALYWAQGASSSNSFCMYESSQRRRSRAASRRARSRKAASSASARLRRAGEAPKPAQARPGARRLREETCSGLSARPHRPRSPLGSDVKSSPTPAGYFAFLRGSPPFPGCPGSHTYLNTPARGRATPEAGPVPQGTSRSSSKSSSSRSRGLLDTWQVSMTCGHRRRDPDGTIPPGTWSPP